MTLDQLAELIWDRYYGGEPRPDAQVSLQQIKLHCLSVRDSIVNIELADEMRQGKVRIDEALIVRYGETQEDAITIEYDDFLKLYYSDLPFSPASLPADMGIFQVYPPGSQESAYVRIERGSMALIPGTIRDLEGNIGWRLSTAASRLEYPNMTAMTKPDYMVIEGVPAEETNDGSKPLSIPSGYDEQIIRRVLDILLPTRGTGDPVNNQNDSPNNQRK